ncbi:MAG TPA: hypothetical protein VEX68_26430 [Bryobacteraceae bacterium]|nr:hypothetical protein [Bryobacteraceae bacterium]
MRRIALTLMTCAFALAADSPFVGIWTMNKTKTKLDPNGPKIESLSIHITQEGSSLKVVVTQNGTVAPAMVLDGKEHPIPSGPGLFGATHYVSTPNGKIIEAVYKRDGKAVGTRKSSLSADGKVMSSVTEGTRPDGEKIHSTMVFDKQ